jgi:hypothetical protein
MVALAADPRDVVKAMRSGAPAINAKTVEE